MTIIIAASKSQILTMSSQEIARLVESRHDNVKRTIERLADRGVIQLPPLEEVKNHLGQSVEEYRVGKRDSYVIVAQLSPEFTARLVDRWQELEEQVTSSPIVLPDFANPAAAARAWAEQFELRQLAEQKARELEGPASVGGLVAKQPRELQVIANLLPGVNTMQVANLLLERKYLRKVHGKYAVYAKYKDHHFHIRLTTVNGKGRQVICVKPKGYEVLVDLYRTGQMVMRKGHEDAWRNFDRMAFEHRLKALIHG